MDGLGGTVENKFFQHVKSGKVKIVDAEGFQVYADEIVEGVKSLYMPEEKIMKDP